MTFIPEICVTETHVASDVKAREWSSSSESMWERLRTEALEALAEEPELATLLHCTVLAQDINSFEDAIAMTICYRILQCPCTIQSGGFPAVFCPKSLNELIRKAMYREDILEMSHNMSEAVRLDALAVLDRDPACETLLEVVLFMKGFAALVCHRAAHQKWVSSCKRRSMLAFFLQSQTSAVFGLDIHPAAQIGAGILMDHGTGIVIGETAVLGDGCTLLHGVTLGGTGKEHGDRHPKVGPHVLIGAGASILGNIQIGAGAKIGAGSIVLSSIPAGATAVGAPAKIIGRALEADPASTMDESLNQVGMLHKCSVNSTISLSTRSMTSNDDTTSEELNSFESAPDTVFEQHFSTNKNHESDFTPGSVCPFWHYTKMAQTAPKGTVTIETLRKLLLKEGCTQYEIGCMLFELDTQNVGYVDWGAFEQGYAAAFRNCITSISKTRMEELAKTFKEDRSKRPVKC
jgi:serine O-acetyltransferase